MTANFNTFGNTRDRGTGFMWADHLNNRVICLREGAYGTPIYLTFNITGYSLFRTMTSRPHDKITSVGFSTQPAAYSWTNFSAKGFNPVHSHVRYIKGNNTPISSNYPYQIAWSDDGTDTGKFAVTCWPNQTSSTNDFYLSDDGNTWTKQSTIPAGHNHYPSQAIYGNGIWRFVFLGTTKMASSTDNGASWTITDLNSTMGITNSLWGVAYGGGYWAVANFDKVLYTNDVSSASPTWSTDSGHIAYGISYCAQSENWWIGGGTFTGSHYTGLIEKSFRTPNSWSTVYNNSPAAQMYVTTVVENDKGHVIGIGNDYSGGSYNNNRNYVYSTDGGSTWSKSAINADANVNLGAVPIAWASSEKQTRGTSTVWPNPVPPGGSLSTVVDELFSTDLWTGDGSNSRAINNGIDLATDGGLAWIKTRNVGLVHGLFDTVRGKGSSFAYRLKSDDQGVQTELADGVSSFNSNGFTLGNSTLVNGVTYDYVGWTFKKHPKFFDIVSYTGDTNIQKVLSHSLGSDPGMVIIKSTNTAGTSWWTWHTSFGANTSDVGKQMALDSIKGTRDTGTNYAGSAFDWSSPNGAYTQGSYLQGTSSSNITVGYEANQNGWEYVAYLFAHNNGDGGFGPNNDQDIIKCGSYTGNGLANGPFINLGWQPQWVLIKRSAGDGSNWYIFDSARGVVTGGNDQYLYTNTGDAEAAASLIDFDPYGFKITQAGNAGMNNGGIDFIYMAIRY